MHSSFLLSNRFPFDTENSPIGYLIAFLLEYIFVGFASFIAACTLTLGIGGYWFAMAATKEFQHFAPIINDKAKSDEYQSNEFTTLFTELTDGHGIVKQFSESTNFEA